MKNLSKLISVFFLFVVFVTNIQAVNIDECKSDLYFANGIMMKYSSDNAEKTWQKEARKLLLSKPEVYAKIANVKISYNISQGFIDDILESFEQVMSNEWGWRDFTLFFSAYLTEKGIQEDWVPHIKDLVRQTNSYKDSIKLGHNVIVIAHSQGNYYTNEAYDLLDEWMKPYFHMIGVATPANHVAGDGPYVTFHNDMIKSIATGLPTNRENPNPAHNSVFSVEAHDFYTSYMTANNTRVEIQNFILNQVTEHKDAPSQWETDQEFELNTCDYRITVKHRYDPSIEMGEKVYPFAANKKLYQVKGEWVKASCGGGNILSAWDGKKDNECWLIDNPQEEKIIIKRKATGHYSGWASIRSRAEFNNCSRMISYANSVGFTSPSNYNINVSSSNGSSDGYQLCSGGNPSIYYESAISNYNTVLEKTKVIFEKALADAIVIHGEENVEIVYKHEKTNFSQCKVNLPAYGFSTCIGRFSYEILIY